MEVPAKIMSALAGFRYWLLAFIFMATSAIIVSCSGGGSTTITIDPIPDPNAVQVTTNGTIILTIDQADPLIANGVDTALVTAEVYDTGGTLVGDGRTVTFSIAPTGRGTLPASATTKDGIATVKLRAGTVTGGYNITATAGDVSQIAYGEIVAGPPAALTNDAIPVAATTLTANPNSIEVGGETALLTVVAKDQFGNLVEDGTPVSFVVTSDDSLDPGTLSPTSVTTSGGVATSLLTSSGDQSTVTVTAVVGAFNDVTTTAQVGFGEAVIVVVGGGSGTAVEVELEAATNTISVKGTSGSETTTITAIAVDESGELIPTCFDASVPPEPVENIQFDILYGPGGGENLEGNPVSIQKATQDGEAVVSLSSGTVSGTVTIQASVILDGNCDPPVLPDTFFARGILTGIGIEAGDPANITIYPDNLVTPNDDGSISQTFSVLIQDRHGNPVENGTGVFFGLVDNPVPTTADGPPYQGYLSSGSDGETIDASTTFTSATNTFVADGLLAENILIILEGRNEGGHRIDTVNNQTSLTLYNPMIDDETGLDFVAGSTELGTVCGSVQTGNLELDSSCTPTAVGEPGSIKGVAHTTLTWTPQGIFKPFYLYAESVGGDVGHTWPDTYPAVAPVTVLLTIAPDTVQSGTTGISAVAEIFDGEDNPIQGEIMTFSSSSPGVASINAPGYDVTGTKGFAGVTIDTPVCLEGNTNVIITAALGGIYKDTETLTVTGTKPTADFSAANTGTIFIFTNTSTEPPGFTYSYDWNFGGLGTSTAENPAFDFAAATGTDVIVQLTVTNLGQGCTNSISQIISVP